MHDIQYIAIAHIQERGGLAALIDMGGTLEVERGKSFGVNFDELLVSQADTLYGALEIISTLIKTKEVEWIGIDNLNWTFDPEKEAEAKIRIDKEKAELREILLKRKEGEKLNE